jgi:heme/copper-type cytochrome/quinol oxidase subunit 1
LRQAFTRLYWIGLPVPPIICGVATVRAIARGPRDWHSPAFLGLLLSLVLFCFGGILGLFATGADTRTPAHYHAEIGGVNLSFMAMFFAILLPVLLCSGETSRFHRLQFWLYGGGQGLFSLGMFVAGSAGVGRKVAGAEQGLDSLTKVLAMTMTGVGGGIAVTGGIMFVWLALSRLLASTRR